MRTIDGKEIDDDDLEEGFSYFHFKMEDIYAPIVPTAKCKRCGCWLRSQREDKSRRDDDDPLPQREYCSACEAYMMDHAKICVLCGDYFYSEDPSVERCKECDDEYQKEKRSCALCGVEFVPYICTACDGDEKKMFVCHACHWANYHSEEDLKRSRKCSVCGCMYIRHTCGICGEKPKDTCQVCHAKGKHK